MGGRDDPELEREWSAIHAAVELAAESSATVPDAPSPGALTEEPVDDLPETRDDGVDSFDSPDIGGVHEGEL